MCCGSALTTPKGQADRVTPTITRRTHGSASRLSSRASLIARGGAVARGVAVAMSSVPTWLESAARNATRAGTPPRIAPHCGQSLPDGYHRSATASLPPQPSGLTSCTPAVAYTLGGSLNTADRTRDPRRTRPAGYRLTTFAPAIADSVGRSLNTADRALHRSVNHPPGHRCRGIGHPGDHLTHA
jgi:hypothetical protein